MAHAFGSGWIMNGHSGIYVADGILCVEATRAGIPCFTFETGEGGRLEEPLINQGAGYVQNVMRWLNMIDGELVPAQTSYLMSDFLGLRAERGGLLLSHAELGELINTGDKLCSIVNIYGDEIEIITAPTDGVFVRATTLSTVSRGERVATLGLL